MRRSINRRTPSPPTSPPGPKHTHSEHAIDPEPSGYDHDGVGRKEAERVDGEPLCAVREAYSCRRDMCDITPSKSHVYALSDVSERVQQTAEYAVRNAEWFDGVVRSLTTEHVLEYLAMNAVVVDHDDGGPILAFEFGDDTLGYLYPAFTDTSGFGGQCHGRSEPNPDVDAHRYDEL